MQMRCLAIVISPASTISIRKGRNGKAIERKCQRHPIHSYIHPPHSPAKRYESKHQPFLFFLPLCFASPPGKKIAIGLDSRRAPPRRTGLVSISNTRPNPRNGWMLSSFDSRGKAKGVELERSGSRGEEQKTTAIGGTRL
jgi:hypothetical protein